MSILTESADPAWTSMFAMEVFILFQTSVRQALGMFLCAIILLK